MTTSAPIDDPVAYLAALKAFEGREVAPAFTAREPVNRPMIRHWVEAMGVTNPVHLDDAAARASGRDEIVAPAAMLQVWSMGGLAGYPAADTPTARVELDALLNAGGFTSVVATNCEQTYVRELRVGDLITNHEVIEDISAEKRTALGRGHFITSRMTFTDRDGEVVGTQLWRLLRFAPPGASTASEGGR